MSNARSDTAYNYWREASEKFDYYVTGLTGALAAFVGQALHPVPVGLNASTLELAALASLVVSIIVGFKRIETNVHLLSIQSRQTYLQEVAGSSMVASQQKAAINASTGDIYTPQQLVQRAVESKAGAAALDTKFAKLQRVALRYYNWRNVTLLVGFALLVAARILPAYVK